MHKIRTARFDEFERAIAIVLDVFDEFVRPDLGEGGWDKLLEYIDADGARARADADHMMFVAEQGGEIVGVLEVRQHNHVSLLVVDRRFFGRGVARDLLTRGVAHCLEGNPDLERITVHSSRYAVDVYKRLGFEPVGEELEIDGIRFTPLAMKIGDQKR